MRLAPIIWGADYLQNAFDQHLTKFGQVRYIYSAGRLDQFYKGALFGIMITPILTDRMLMTDVKVNAFITKPQQLSLL